MNELSHTSEGSLVSHIQLIGPSLISSQVSSIIDVGKSEKG